MNADKQSKSRTAGLKPFQPGKSGNPKGRPPKVKCIPDILKRITDEELPPSMRAKMQALYPDMQDATFLEAIMRVVVSRAIRGDSWAVQFIAERTEGKVTDVLSVQRGDTVTVVEEIITARKPV